MLNPSLERQLRDIYADAQTIAVIGATMNENKAGFFIPRYLQQQGYRIVPVNPSYTEVLGERAYASLSDVDVPIDVVDVFRPAAEAPSIAKDAVSVGAKVLWLQPGIVSQDAATIGEAAGMTIVMDRCMGATHSELGLGPGP
jgi:predicted CoA-binding protein